MTDRIFIDDMDAGHAIDENAIRSANERVVRLYGKIRGQLAGRDFFASEEFAVGFDSMIPEQLADADFARIQFGLDARPEQAGPDVAHGMTINPA